MRFPCLLPIETYMQIEYHLEENGRLKLVLQKGCEQKALLLNDVTTLQAKLDIAVSGNQMLKAKAQSLRQVIHWQLEIQ